MNLHSLPGLPITLGPYTLLMTMLPREQMPDKRRYGTLSLEKGLFALRMDISGKDLARAFLSTLIRFIHYSRGCQEGCVEEAYTHSLSTGLVEFAQRNPEVWSWFNTLLASITPAARKSSRIASAPVGAADAPPPPRRFLIGDHAVSLASIKTWQTNGAYGWYHYNDHRAELWDKLHGANLAVVAIHEFTHAIHQSRGIPMNARSMKKPKAKEGAKTKKTLQHRHFRIAETEGWLAFMLDNPAAWQWIVYLATHEAARMPHIAPEAIAVLTD